MNTPIAMPDIAAAPSVCCPSADPPPFEVSSSESSSISIGGRSGRSGRTSGCSPQPARVPPIESCGKCTPCRIGSTRGVETITKIINGDRVAENLAVVEDLCNTMKFGSLCALGGFTPYPVLSALKHFREDFGPVPARLQAAE